MRPRRTPSPAIAADRTRPDSPQDAAVEALAGVLVDHLRSKAAARKRGECPSRPDEASPPILVHLDGMGAHELLDSVDARLRSGESKPRWMVVRFDAWQYQRVQPPWWWLLSAFDSRLRRDQRRRGPHHWALGRIRDYGWRAGRVLRDLWILLPIGLLLLALGATSLESMDAAATKVATLVGALTTFAVLIRTAVRAIRHHLFLFSPADDKALLRTRDPMADLQARYAFQLRSAGGPVAVLIDNLDRCRSEYVVELLEGIQTLLKHLPKSGKEPPLVAFVVAADETWLCNSFLDVYDDLAGSVAEPGRPFGLDFLDRVFDYSLRLPTVPGMVARPHTDTGEKRCSLAEKRIEEAKKERDIRRIVAAAEIEAAPDDGAPIPLQDLRIAAVKRLGDLDDPFGGASCSDTNKHLEELIGKLDAAGAVRTRLRAGYCSQRTRQLLAGHKIDCDEHAIRRLILWTILWLRWPLLARDLSADPTHVDDLRKRQVPATVEPHLGPVFTDGCASQVALGWPGEVELTQDDIRRFTTPASSAPPPLHLPVAPRDDERLAAHEPVAA